MATPPKTRRKAATPLAVPAVAESAATPARKRAPKSAAVPEVQAALNPRRKTAKPAEAVAAEAVSEAVVTSKPAARKRTANQTEPQGAVPVVEVAPTPAPKKAAARKAPSKQAPAKKKPAVPKTAQGIAAIASAAPPAEATTEKAKGAAKPESKTQPKTQPKPKPSTKRAKSTSKAAKPVAAEAAKAEEAESPYQLTADPGETLFGRFELLDMRNQERVQIELRGAATGHYRCSCASFMRSPDARCAHSDFLLDQLQQGGEPIQAMLLQGPQTEYSEVWLGYGLQRRMYWRAGRSATAELVDASRALLDAHASTSAENAPILNQLLQLAALAGHELRVDDQIWPQLAWAADAQQRVMRLEPAFAEGAEGATLAGLLRRTLPVYQWEAALFAVCAGRALLADDLGLSQRVPALTALRLWQQYFGVDTALLIAPGDRHELWRDEAQSLLGGWPQGLLLLDPSEVEPSTVCDLLIVDAVQEITLPFQRLPQEPQYCLLLADRELLGEPMLELWIDWLDCARRGALASLKSLGDQPAKRQQREALQSVMLSRRRRDMADQLPPTLETNVWLDPTVVLDGAAVAQARALLQRWQQLAYLSHAEQLQLMQCLSGLRRVSQASAVCAAKAEAVVALLPHIVPEAASRVLVAALDDATLLPLAGRLQALGLSVHSLLRSQFRPEREAALAAWRSDQGQVLLATDAACIGLELTQEGVALIHADLPWNPALRQQRVLRLAGAAHGVPVWQLLIEGSLDAGLLKAQDGQVQLAAGTLDAELGAQPFVPATELGRFMAALAVVLAELPLAV